MSQLIVVGSGTGIPSLRRGSPGLLLISRDSKVLIDSGPGALRRIVELGVSYLDLDLLLYTHAHPDHVADLVPILFASKYSELPRQKDLLCIGGPGFQDHFEKLKGIYGPWIEPETYRLKVAEISKKPVSFNDLKILAKPTAHLQGSVAYRIEFGDGGSVVISGDTDYCRSLVELAMEVDLLVLECSFPDEKKVEGHLTPSLAGRIALESRCKRLLLTHLYPICDRFDIVEECRRNYGGEILLAEDSMKIEI
jgi:ribonuclease BN (tRNA processing enzyme)